MLSYFTFLCYILLYVYLNKRNILNCSVFYVTYTKLYSREHNAFKNVYFLYKNIATENLNVFKETFVKERKKEKNIHYF